jgi:hypothetical protein
MVSETSTKTTGPVMMAKGRYEAKKDDGRWRPKGMVGGGMMSKGMKAGGMKKGGMISKGVEDLKRGVSSTEDAISRSFETKRGVELDKELGFRDQKGKKVLLPKTTQKQREEIRDMQYLRKGLQNQTEDEAQKRREARGMKKGGMMSKGMAAGGMMSKGYAAGGAAKKKMKATVVARYAGKLMAYLISNIPYFKCWVRREFTHMHQISIEGEYLHAMAIAVTSMPDRCLKLSACFHRLRERCRWLPKRPWRRDVGQDADHGIGG